MGGRTGECLVAARDDFEDGIGFGDNVAAAFGDVCLIWELPEAGPARSDGSAGIAGLAGSVAILGLCVVCCGEDVVQRAALVEHSQLGL